MIENFFQIGLTVDAAFAAGCRPAAGFGDLLAAILAVDCSRAVWAVAVMSVQDGGLKLLVDFLGAVHFIGHSGTLSEGELRPCG